MKSLSRKGTIPQLSHKIFGSCNNYAVAIPTYGITIGFPIGSVRHGQAGQSVIILAKSIDQLSPLLKLIKRHVIKKGQMCLSL